MCHKRQTDDNAFRLGGDIASIIQSSLKAKLTPQSYVINVA